MPKVAWENLDDFLSTDDFAFTATFVLKSGEIREINGIYDDPYMDADLGEYAADLSEPRFTCKMVDAVGLRRGDTCTIAGEDGQFDVMSDPQGDGTGLAVIRLSHDVGP